MAPVVAYQGRNRTIHVLLLLAFLCLGIFFQLHFEGFQLRTALVDSITLFVLMLLMSSLLQMIQRYYHARVVLNSTNISLTILLIALTVLTHFLVSSVFHSPLDTHYADYLNQTWFYRFGLIALMYLILLLLFWIDQRRIQEEKTKNFAIEMERENVSIEMNSIQQQFKPHFLFNSLNSINALTISNPAEARKMIQLLSEFMRGSVRQDQEALIPLREEIHHLKLYTEIEQVRFGSRLNVEYHIPDALLEWKVPALILQPIIENAVKYGLYGHTEAVTISISAEANEELLTIRVSNPFDAITQRTNKGTGFGLRSIERKLLLLYGRSNLLRSETNDTVYTTILQIPIA